MIRCASVCLVLLILGGGGCSSSSRELSTESQNAQSAIDRAENAGAKKYAESDYAAAKNELETARAAEEGAIRDKNAAQQQILAAQRRDDRARARTANRKAALGEVSEQRQQLLLQLDATQQHGEELRAKGVPEDEVTSVTEPREQMLKIKIKSLESEIDSMTKDIRAMDAVRKDAAIELDAARQRLKSAEERLSAARASYARVEQRANVARANALDARRGELSHEIGALSP